MIERYAAALAEEMQAESALARAIYERASAELKLFGPEGCMGDGISLGRLADVPAAPFRPDLDHAQAAS